MRCRAVTLLLLAGILCLHPAAGESARPPNLVIILADDLGYGDLGCYGHPTIRTPHLDRMAAEGMRLTDFYSAAPVCTPSRAALLTGRYPVRSGMAGPRRRVLFPDSPGGLPAEEITLAEALRGRGYATACIGKWHLGHQPHHLPGRHGFDSYFGLPYSNDMDGVPGLPAGASGSMEPQVDWWSVPLLRNDEVIERPAHQPTLTRRYAEEAVAFIRRSRGRPFLLYLAHTMPHVPLFRSSEFRDRSARGLYGDVIEELDASVGAVLETLRKQHLARSTLVFFTSDNGPWLSQRLAGGSAGLLRDGKGSTWEGGMRVPGIAWWPGRVPAGRVESGLACTMDLFCTALALASVEPPRDRPIDGVDLSALLLGKDRSPRDVFFYYRDTELYAVRKGPWKAHLLTRPGYGPAAPERHEPPLLFHLGRDPSEQLNVAANQPDVLVDLGKEVARHRDGTPPAPSQVE